MNAEWISAISGVVTVVLAAIVLIYFNVHTKESEKHTMDTEDLERHHLNVDGQRMFLEEFRSQIGMVHKAIEQIHEENILEIVDKLDGDIKNISLKESKKLEYVVFQANDVVQLVENQLISTSEWGKFFKDNQRNLEGKLAIAEYLTPQLNIVKEFIIDIDYRLNAVNDERFSKIKGISASEIYMKLNSEKVDSKSEGKNTVLMVALRRSEENDSWLKQSLGNWIISLDRAKTVDYIVGIDIATRNLVSLTKVSSPISVINKDTGEKRVRFMQEKGMAAEQKYDDVKDLDFNDARYWNARNPVKYLYKTTSEIGNLEKQLKESV